MKILILLILLLVLLTCHQAFINGGALPSSTSDVSRMLQYLCR
ncbi:hypothetical protein [uncultured Chitinophaga sp.]|nr:hypothetical protein [uncultured Chitinophaga sp.]